ncbi:MAG: YdcF family protein [Oscillatoriaceae bacterium SKW80]|nr:YdcF family protein [Oscillatoriaceae bacterium SKYG93]MCX8122418.1 YdcF family protein [Oscillatoriaceae bacterium SKW80]MDW8452657.1 YdcF family protein [Oscillatoriaceae cyanobacterium SKYGB_i_bin93]HIK28017.1 YdcF family protein [Oscillatoriaceae cyanobacterium M7585_C2015_266]
MQLKNKNKSYGRIFSKVSGLIAGRIFAIIGLVLTVTVVVWLTLNTITLRSRADGKIDAILVLGGSIQREIHVAELAKQYPQTPILISQGSQEPCIWLIFQKARAPMQQVVLEKCAQSTFGNFYFTLPILKSRQVHRLKVITSPTHLPRAQWLAQILLGSHGIWVDVELVNEKGIPGNRESWLKTTLDVTRSLIWAFISHFYQPQCTAIISLVSVDIENWKRRGFVCEHQAHL